MMLRLGLVLLLVPGLLLMGTYLTELSAVEACLDAGGSYNYRLGACDQAASHPYSSFLQRHMLLVNGGMLLSVVGLFCCLVGLYSRDNRRR